MSEWTRREFMRTTVGMSAAWSLGGWLPSVACAKPDPPTGTALSVDAHCHIFNAEDLPIAGFADEVFLRERGYEPFVIHHIVKYILRTGAPGFQSEKRKLEELLTNRSAMGREPLEPSDEEFEVFLRNLRDQDPAELERLIQRETGRERDVRRLELRDLRAESRSTSVRAVFEWAWLLTRYRFVIARKMAEQLYPSVQLFTPALVDMDLWVNGTSGVLIPQQIVLQEKIVRLFGGRIHPFVAFDPMREKVSKETGGFSALYWAKHAVHERGFLGVKVYPPMGFYPSGNDDPGLEAALQDLYAWCVAEDVPIQAHCNDSNGAGPDYGGRANPIYWASVLDRHPALRLNLGHFGGVEDLIDKGEQSWAWKIGELMNRPGSQVYADCGYHSFALDQDEAKAAQYFDRLEALFAAYPAARGRLLYGSDWQMIHVDRGREAYRSTYLDYFGDRFPDLGDGFAGGNAFAFLGLDTSGSKARERLRTFYDTHAIPDPAWW
jgi:predicted TIM-barrel fold metal-dependent hydrolase